MFRKIAVVVVCSVAFVFSSNVTQAQFGGIQVGGYGPGIRVGNYGYGNSYYGRYGGGFGNPYYGNQYSRGYGGYNNFGFGGFYGNGNSFNRNPGFNYQYLGPRVYAAPLRGTVARRYRYR